MNREAKALSKLRTGGSVVSVSPALVRIDAVLQNQRRQRILPAEYINAIGRFF